MDLDTEGKFKNKRKATKWELLFLYAKNGIAISKGILIVPLYLKYIDIDYYGAWLATGNILAWIQMVDPGTSQVIKQKVGEAFGSKTQEQLSSIFTSGFIINAFVSFLVLCFALGFYFFLPKILLISSPNLIVKVRVAYFISIIALSIRLISYSFSAFNRGVLRTKQTGFIMFLGDLIGLSVIVICLFNQFNIVSIAIGNLSASIIIISGNIILFSKIAIVEKLKLKFDKNKIKELFGIISFSFFSKISTVFVEKFDLIIIQRFIGAEMVTAFELTRRPINLVLGFTDKSSLALIPALSNIKGGGDVKKFRSVLLQFFKFIILFSFMIVSLFILLNKAIIPLWTGKNIYIGNELNLLLCITLLLKSLTYNLSNFTFSYGDIKGNSIVNIFKSMLYIPFLFLLTKHFQIYGVVIALLFAIVLSEFWYYPYKINKLINFSNFEKTSFYRQIFILLPFVAIVSVLSFYISIDTWRMLLIIGFGMIVFYLLYVYLAIKELRILLKKKFLYNDKISIKLRKIWRNITK